MLLKLKLIYNKSLLLLLRASRESDCLPCKITDCSHARNLLVIVLEVARRLGLDLGLELLLKSRLDLVSKKYFRDEQSRNFSFVEDKIPKIDVLLAKFS